MTGLMLGTVVEHYEEAHPGMVRVRFPELEDEGCETRWLPVLSPYAGAEHGLYFLPEVDDTVLVGFLGGDADCGVVLGCLWNEKNPHPAETVTEENTAKRILTKGGVSLTLTDGEACALTLKTAAGHTVSLLDKEKKITLTTAGGKESVTLDEEGGTVTVESGDKLTLKAAEVSVEGKLTVKGSDIALEADSKLTLKGQSLELSGSTLKLDGQSAELTGSNVKVESSSMLTLKGSMTKIN